MLDIRITSDKSEMIEIGRELYKKRRLYTKAQAESIKKTIYHFMPNATDKERERCRIISKSHSEYPRQNLI